MIEVLKSLFENLKYRISNPLIGSYAIFWGIYNWRFLYYMFAADKPAEIKIQYLVTLYSDDPLFIWQSTFIPAAFTLLSPIFFPYLIQFIQFVQKKPNSARILNKVSTDYMKQRAIILEEIEIEDLKLKLENKKIDRLNAESKVHALDNKVIESKNNQSKKANKNKSEDKILKVESDRKSISTIKPIAIPKQDKKIISKRVGSNSYTLNKNLNLHKEGKKPGLSDFMESYKANSNFARYLLFTHYLLEIKELDTVDLEDLYTCFKFLSIKVPNISQGIRDTSRKKGWLDSSSSTNIRITTAGENAITHELLLDNQIE